mmetsp:Transcript_40292/g.66638  ORF Transcript_40292/g.66638 Transcript_40292/m.66638 type:complete len:209 (-) Transcript_40292:300-926(-)
MGMMIGRSLTRPMLVSTASLNVPGTVVRPRSTFGRNPSTSSSRGVPSLTSGFTQGALSGPRPRWWLGSPRAPSARPSAPLLVTITKRERASVSLRPSSIMPSMICSHTPSPALPAPAHTTRASRSAVPAARQALSRPATVTAPVPWMSSLKARARGAHRSSRRKALWLPKSSNCSITDSPNLSIAAVMNSSTNSSYSDPVTRSCLSPM